MTTPAPRDLTAIVEKVARDFHERFNARLDQENPGGTYPSWEHLNAMSKHAIREAVLPIVVATISAIDQEEL